MCDLKMDQLARSCVGGVEKNEVLNVGQAPFQGMIRKNFYFLKKFKVNGKICR